MNDAAWQETWRSAEPEPDFAHRVVLELEREERLGAQSLGRRRAATHRRWSPLGILGMAALLLSGAAAASFGAHREPVLVNVAQEDVPTHKTRSEPPRLHLLTPAAPMMPERAAPEAPPFERPLRAVQPEPSVETPRSVPIHYPPCHCSSGAVVCSCVD
jgi:hypothetical protein